ncbi:MAG: hypothetical protein JST16_02480 [Bdellovibrionales bacterium]|nr:hypothetical protein [Bdellovibrionales bacterium]
MSFRKSYYWDTRRLALDLRAGQVSESFKAKAFAFTGALLYFQPLTAGLEGPPNFWSNLSAVLSGAGFILSVILTYRLNRAGDDRDFVGRFAALSLPLTIKLFLLQFLVAVPLSLGLTNPEATQASTEFQVFEAGFSLLLDALWIVRMRQYFIWIRSEPKN